MVGPVALLGDPLSSFSGARSSAKLLQAPPQALVW
jgi:hypothetical protein